MKLKKISIVLMILFSYIVNAFAQNAGSISGTVKKDNEAAPSATISLLRSKDSALIKLSVADKGGDFVFDHVPSGRYLVSVSIAGHQKSYTTPFNIDAASPHVSLPAINLILLEKTLSDVTVTSKKTLIEQRIDRTIVNVDASITNIGTSAMEILEKSPGVTVDNDGNISLKGKQGVLVMVDGRPTQLGGADLANLLRNMSAAQLDQIEIMTNPPARYDAAGSPGIINIKTKKTITAGFNGSANVAYSHGRYPKTSEGFTLNYRKDKINFFTNLGHNYQKRFSELNIDRNIFYPNTTTVKNIFNQEADRRTAGNAYNGKIGIDFFATKATTLGAIVNFNLRGQSSPNTNSTFISDADKQLQSVTTALVNNEATFNGVSTNLNFRTVFDKKRKELTADIDMVQYNSYNDLFMVNAYEDAAGSFYRKADTLTGTLPQQISIYTGRADYLYNIKKDVKFEAGIKTGIVRTDNNANYDSIQHGRIIHDFARSNHFIYEENINAAYVNFSTPFSKKITGQFGLRLENTNAHGKQMTTGENFKRNYTELFPTVYLQYKADENNNFGANAGRRVGRPNYYSLNPFIRFIDRYTFSQGNPNLKPYISNNIELSHSWKNKINTTLNYTHVKDMIQEIIQQKADEAYNTPDNVASLQQLGLSVNANTNFFKWWTSNININISHTNYKGDINTIPIDLSMTSFILMGTQQFKLNKSLTAEVTGRFRSGWLEGVVRVKPVGIADLGLSQDVLKKKGSIRFSLRDIFWSQRMRGKTQYGNVDMQIRQASESRVATIGFTYRFSKGKKIAPVKRSQGSANEEQGRMGQ